MFKLTETIKERPQTKKMLKIMEFKDAQKLLSNLLSNVYKEEKKRKKNT